MTTRVTESTRRESVKPMHISFALAMRADSLFSSRAPALLFCVPTPRSLIVCLEVTCHLTMKLFLAKICERACYISKSVTPEGNSVLLTDDRRYSVVK